jgi:hypothetical protein
MIITHIDRIYVNGHTRVNIEEIFRLKDSISEVGVIKPIRAQKFDDRFYILKGINKYCACKELGIDIVPVAHIDEKLVYSLKEVVELFRYEIGGEVDTEEKAEGLCHHYSTRFKYFCKNHGISGVEIRSYNYRKSSHHVNTIKGVVIDWTMRQFMPDADIPTIMPMAQHNEMMIEYLDY